MSKPARLIHARQVRHVGCVICATRCAVPRAPDTSASPGRCVQSPRNRRHPPPDAPDAPAHLTHPRTLQPLVPSADRGRNESARFLGVRSVAASAILFRACGLLRWSTARYCPDRLTAVRVAFVRTIRAWLPSFAALARCVHWRNRGVGIGGALVNRHGHLPSDFEGRPSCCTLPAQSDTTRTAFQEKLACGDLPQARDRTRMR